MITTLPTVPRDAPLRLAARIDKGHVHSLWSPGVRAFRRVRFSAKAGLISFAFLVPLLLLGGLFIQTKLDTLRTTALEREGVAYLKPVTQLVQKAGALHDLMLLQAAQHTDGGVAAARQALDEQFARVGEVDRALGDRLGTHDKVGLVRDALQALASPADGVMKVYASNTRLSRAIAALAVAAADGGQLTLDPDLDTYYLVDAGLMLMPRMTDRVARMRTLATAVAALGKGGDIAAVELNRLDTLGDDQFTRVRAGIDKVISVHGEAKAALDLSVMGKLLEGLRDQATDAPGTGGQERAAKLHALGDQTVQAAWAAQATMADLLDELLAQRQGEARRALGTVGAAVAACLLLAAYLFYAFYLVMSSGLNEMRRHMDLMAGGDLTSSPTPWGRDEAAKVMQSMCAMQVSLRGIVRQVRTAAEQIASASSQIAQGASDMSGRTEQAAASLQQSSSSMADISGTVGRTTEVVGEAAQLAQGNASVALRGGEIIGNMVATMDEINTSSRRINDIIGTIDGIAFQTNILALNAAVEAARAGEQGRGFAVVASEVRALAQRSASAAREIKSLIGTSVEKVESGAAVVRDAGETMDRIVANADRIRTLLQEISQGAQLQNQGLQSIGGAVRDLDETTQHNAALSEQTAAAAGSLNDRANQLVADVARFRLPD